MIAKIRKQLRCCFAFTTRLYCVLCLIVFPALIVAVHVVLKWTASTYSLYGFSIICCFLLVEIVGDYFTLGGIASKQIEKLSFLKTSARGGRLLKNVMIADMIRRFVYFFLEICSVAVIVGCLPVRDGMENNSYGNWPPVFMGVLLMGYFYGTFGSMIARFFESFRISFVIWYLSFFPVGISIHILYRTPSSYVLSVVYLLLSVLISVLNICFVLKRLRSEPQ